MAPTKSTAPKPSTAQPAVRATLTSLATALKSRLLELNVDGAVHAAVTEYTASVADWALDQVSQAARAHPPPPTTPNPPPSTSYAAALKTPPQPLFTKEQRELLVRRPKDPNFDPRTTLAAVNTKLRKELLGSFVGVRALPSGDLIFIADSATTKRAAELNVDKWQTALGADATVQPKRYTVLVHGVSTSLLPNDTQQDNIATLFAANPRLRHQVQILRTWWRKRVEVVISLMLS